MPLVGTEYDAELPILLGLENRKVISPLLQELRIWSGSTNDDQFEPALRAHLRECYGKPIEPKFSAKELVALALLSKVERKANMIYINNWICDKFTYFAKGIIRQHAKGDFSPSPIYNAVHDVLEKQTSHYDVDFQVSSGLDADCASEPVYALPPGVESQIFQNWCLPGAACQSNTTILDLPEEILVKILRYVLRFPNDRWLVVEKDRPIAISVPGTRLRHFMYRPTGLGTPHYEELPLLHAPLRVNRTFHRLGSEILYAENKFACFNVSKGLSKLHENISERYLEGIGEHNRRLIGGFKFNINPARGLSVMGTLKLLGQSTRLKCLEIEVMEGVSQQDMRSTHAYAKLRAFRGVEHVRFSGQCAIAKEYLEPEMKKPKKDRKGPAYQLERKKRRPNVNVSRKRPKVQAVPKSASGRSSQAYAEPHLAQLTATINTSPLNAIPTLWNPQAEYSMALAPQYDPLQCQNFNSMCSFGEYVQPLGDGSQFYNGGIEQEIGFLESPWNFQ